MGAGITGAMDEKIYQKTIDGLFGQFIEANLLQRDIDSADIEASLGAFDQPDIEDRASLSLAHSTPNPSLLKRGIL